VNLDFKLKTGGFSVHCGIFVDSLLVYFLYRGCTLSVLEEELSQPSNIEDPVEDLLVIHL